MQLSSIQSAVLALQSELNRVDIDALSGSGASALVSALVPLRNVVGVSVSAAGVRAISCNQHNADGARSGAAWLGAHLGISEKQARGQLAMQKTLSELPAVMAAVRGGSLSLEKASVISRGAEGNKLVAQQLLTTATSDTFEQLQRRVRKIQAGDSNHKKRRRLRNSQFIDLSIGSDAMVNGRFRLLPEHATGLLAIYKKAKGLEAWERAEDFAHRIGESSGKQAEVVFHLDVKTNNDGELLVGDRCELKGVGPVARNAALQFLAQASLKMIGTIDNKLAFFSERHGSKKELPEFVKRAVKYLGYDECSTQGCTNDAEQVDHKLARINGGHNDFENLQPLCEACHHAKTKHDAPWTTGGIYAKTRAARTSERERRRERERIAPDEAGGAGEWDGEMFPDTG